MMLHLHQPRFTAMNNNQYHHISIPLPRESVQLVYYSQGDHVPD